MPELPQIQPSGGLEGGAGVVKSEPNPLGGQIAQQAGQIADQAIEMGKQAQRMNRYINFHAADADYIAKSADIFAATRSIPDPDVQHQTRVRVLGELKDQLSKQYGPAAGPELGPQLTVRMAEDVRRSSLESTAQGVQNARDNLDALSTKSVLAGSAAATPADMDTVVNNFKQTLDLNVRHGMIGTGEANKRFETFQYKLQFALVSKQSLIDPLSVQAMKPEESGLLPQDLSLIQYRSAGVQQRKDSTATRDFRNVINANDDAVFHGQITDPNVINQLHVDGKLSQEAVKYGTHEEPRNHAVSDPILKYINSAPDMTPDEWRHFKATAIDNNGKLEEGDRRAADSAIAARISDGQTKEGSLKKTYIAEIKRALKNKYPGAFGTMADQPTLANYDKELESSIAQLDGATSFKELKTIRDDILKNATPNVDVKPILSDADKAKKLMDALDKLK